jgi:hypothetical protein
MGELVERLGVAHAILKTLSYGPMRRTALEKRLFRTKDISYACFSNMFAFLVVDGDIEKVSAERTAPYQLTEKGKLFWLGGQSLESSLQQIKGGFEIFFTFIWRCLSQWNRIL